MKRPIYFFLLGIITLVSCYDVYASIKYQEVLYSNEENPIGRWLIRLDNGDVALFMTVKMVGTAAVLLSLAALRRWKPIWGWTVTTCLGTFQAGLLYYLTCA